MTRKEDKYSQSLYNLLVDPLGQTWYALKMEDEKKTVDNLEQVFAAGDAWLRRYGMVTGVQHNSVVLNLYMAFPKVRYVEYFLPKDQTKRKVLVQLYFPFWKLVFMNKDKMIDDVIFFLREYLNDYEVRVELKRYKKGVEKSDEVPNEASDLTSVAPDPVDVAVPDKLEEPASTPGDPEAKPEDRS